MKNALLKDTFREIRRSLSRFISIFAIVFIGVAFFAGVKATGPDMKLTADSYFDEYHLMDIRLLSTMGFNDDDVNAVKNVPGVDGVMPSYSMYALVKAGEKDQVISVISLPTEKINRPDESYINRVKLIEGRYPQRPGECLTEKGKIVNSGMSIGSKIKLTSGTEKNIGESLKTNEFTIVGYVETPYYISFERGSSSIGSGKVYSFIMIPQENFKLPVYTDIFLTAKNAREKLSYDNAYDDVIKPVKDALEDTEKCRAQTRYDEIVKEANDKLDEAKMDLKEAEDKQKTELSDALAKLEDSRRQIDEGEKELNQKEDKFNKKIKAAEAEIVSGNEKLRAGEKEYDRQLQAYNAAKLAADREFPAAEQQIAVSQAEINRKEAELKALEEALASGQVKSEQEKDALENAVETGREQLAAAKEQLAAAKVHLEEKKKSLSDTEQKLVMSRKTLDKNKQQLEKSAKELRTSKAKGQAELSDAGAKLEESRRKLKQGEVDYEQSKNDSDRELTEARKKISDNEGKIKDIEKPVWYVLDRDTNPGFADYGGAADRMDAIAEVFPLFFFFIAALVCLTTITRMVDEQRTTIGTLKALGYGKASIASKFLLYAILASTGGSITGLLSGFRIFPTVIFNAYGILYTLPPVITAFHISYAAATTGFAILATTLAAWFACYNELVMAPALLMRPRAPKSGKRILLDRVGFIWSRLNFLQKVTARNLFRYKQRFFMTLFGIGGCTALLLSGFGLRDSIMSIVTKQFDELYQYQMLADLKDGIISGEKAGVIDVINEDKRISEYMLMREQSVDVGTGRIEKNADLIVPENVEKLKRFIILRDRVSGKEVQLGEGGVVLTEKLAKMLQVHVGDDIYIKNGDDKQAAVKVNGITENYVSHYIYMPPELYETIYKEKVKYQNITVKTTDITKEFEDRLSTDMLKNPGIAAIRFTTGISSHFKDIIGSLNYIVLVLIVSAGLLAFVVLYNLTNINISERYREIATIKVLGFYDNEVSSYVYRENIILTLLGMLLGLFLGIFLHKFIVVTAEVDYVMFGRVIEPLSYLYSAVLTVCFSALVNFVMYFRLRKIKMVESLKSVD